MRNYGEWARQQPDGVGEVAAALVMMTTIRRAVVSTVFAAAGKGAIKQPSAYQGHGGMAADFEGAAATLQAAEADDCRTHHQQQDCRADMKDGDLEHHGNARRDPCAVAQEVGKEHGLALTGHQRVDHAQGKGESDGNGRGGEIAEARPSAAVAAPQTPACRSSRPVSSA